MFCKKFKPKKYKVKEPMKPIVTPPGELVDPKSSTTTEDKSEQKQEK